MPSNNPYTSSYVEDYFAQMSPDEKAKLMPMFQNTAQQQNFENQMTGQTGQLAQQAGQPGNNPMAGMNTALMAALLRKDNKAPGLGETTNAFGYTVKDPTYGAGTAYSKMTKEELNNMMANGV